MQLTAIDVPTAAKRARSLSITRIKLASNVASHIQVYLKVAMERDTGGFISAFLGPRACRDFRRSIRPNKRCADIRRFRNTELVIDGSTFRAELITTEN